MLPLKKIAMKRELLFVACFAICYLEIATLNRSDAGAEPPKTTVPTKQAILWTSGDPEVAHRMVFMYLGNSQKAQWYDENLLIVWGPSARLLAADKDLKAEVTKMMADGVRVQACITCAELYGVVEELRKLGIEVKSMGRPLADLVKSDWHVLTL